MSSPNPIEFRAYETIPGADPEGEAKELAELVAKLMSDDDTKPYREAHNGTKFKSPDRSGYLTIEVLPQLTGLPFNNLALAYLKAVRPSDVRVSHGEICCDAYCWRVTVFLDDKDLIKKIVQEVSVGYSCGSDIRRILQATKEGKLSELKPLGSCIGHTAGLARVDFQ